MNWIKFSYIAFGISSLLFTFIRSVRDRKDKKHSSKSITCDQYAKQKKIHKLEEYCNYLVAVTVLVLGFFSKDEKTTIIASIILVGFIMLCYYILRKKYHYNK